MDLIGKIYPPSSKQHTFILVAMDYFTKWVEAKPLKTTTYVEIINFIKPQVWNSSTITLDHGTAFNGNLMDEFIKAYENFLINSTPYYAQANG